MATADNAGVVRTVYAAFNARDMDTIASHFTSDAKVTSMPFGKAVPHREDWEAWSNAFPDGKIEVTNLVAQGDQVVAEIFGSGTHTGTLRSPTGDIPATGRHAEMPLVEVFRFRGGKISEMRYYFDAFSFLQQLGVGQQQPAAATGGEARGTPAAY